MPLALEALFTLVSTMSTPVETLPLLQFGDADRAASWRPVHDGVMGGLSDGRATAVEGAVRFAGHVSLENNGGFASFRLDARLPDLSGHDGLRLRVRGDGRVVKLSLRTDRAWDGISWQAPFATRAGEWTTVDIAFEELVPTWRGRLVAQAGSFDAASIRQVGIVIADKQHGNYELEVRSIDGWRDWSIEPGSRGAVRERTRELATLLKRSPGAEELLAHLRGTERLLVVAAPGDLDAAAAIQIGRTVAGADRLAQREVRTLHLMGSRAGRLAGRTLTGQVVGDLRERLGLELGEFAVALVDENGDVAGRWAGPVDPAELLRLLPDAPVRSGAPAQ
jgi:monofunctional biosynthetic peptidoglycan transglycosylase